jgi:anti-sigma factor RsiW
MRGVLHRERSSLSQAERLALEEHLQACARCAQDVQTVEGIRRLLDRLPLRPLGPRGIDKAIGGAFVKAQASPSARVLTQASGARPWIPVAATLAIAAAVALVWVATRGSKGAVPSHASNSPAAAAPASARPGSTDRIVNGEIEVSHSTLSSGDEVPAHVTLRSARGKRLSLGPATLHAVEDSSIVWENDAATVHLASGSIDVVVDPARRSRFRVRTAEFFVEVVGTAFRVTLDGVRVDHGKVRILGSRGELVTELGAGEGWRAGVAVRAPRSELAAGAAAPRSASLQKPEPALSADAWLARARAELQKGDVSAAQRAIAAALTTKHTRAQAAEALTLQAECAQVAGKPGDAVRLYLDVARRHPRLPAAEIALFAAARLEANRGRQRDARALFQRYLTEYPDGRFEADARARLRALVESGASGD